MRAARHNAALLAAPGFDAALLLPNSFLAAWIARRAGIPERWGFARDLRRRLLTRALPLPPAHVHQAEYYQALGAGLGVPSGPRLARVEVSADAERRARALLSERGVPADRRFVVMAPGAAYGRAKQWPPERFAELARRLAEAEIESVLVGARADAAVCRAIVSDAGRGVDLCGATDLAALAALLRLATAVVANDSGAMHLAGAVGARLVAIFGPTNEQKTFPLSAGDGMPPPRLLVTDVWCRPCMLRECPIDHRCMRRIEAAHVAQVLQS